MKTTFIQAIASTLEAIENCKRANNTGWESRHGETLDKLSECLPHGSGIDGRCHIDTTRSQSDRVVIVTEFHHMNDGGFYDGWTEHTLVITPAFRGIDIRITGRDRNRIKDYLHEVFYFALMSEIDVYAIAMSETYDSPYDLEENDPLVQSKLKGA